MHHSKPDLEITTANREQESRIGEGARPVLPFLSLSGWAGSLVRRREVPHSMHIYTNLLSLREFLFT